jgi:hypothetical protein
MVKYEIYPQAFGLNVPQCITICFRQTKAPLVRITRLKSPRAHHGRYYMVSNSSDDLAKEGQLQALCVTVPCSLESSSEPL